MASSKKRPGVMLYFDLIPSFENFSFEEKGKLLDAILKYGHSGEEPELDSKLSIAWYFIKPRIDEDGKAYQKKVEKAQAAADARWAKKKRLEFCACEHMQTDTDACEHMQTDTDACEHMQTDTDACERTFLCQLNSTHNNSTQLISSHLIYTPPTPPEGGWGFGENLNVAFDDWLQYKYERREIYKQKGLESLITQIMKKVAMYGEAAVIEAIRDSMASGYKGIVFAKIQKQHDSSQKVVGFPQADNTWMKKYIQERDHKEVVPR